MLIAILPDLHITSEGTQSLFSWDDTQFEQFLLSLADSVDEVYTLGDTFDLWRARGLSKKSQEKELKGIVQAYPKTVDFFRNHPKFRGMLVGNHDSMMSQFGKSTYWNSKVCEQVVLVNSKYEKVVLWHGHLDFSNKVLPFLGHFITWIAAWMERLFIRNGSIYGKIRNLTKSHVFRNQTQVKHTEKMMDVDDAIVCLVNGHTHKAEIRHFEYRSKKRTYINAGYFDGRVQDVIILNTETLEITKSPVIPDDYSSVKSIVQKGDVLLTFNRYNALSEAITTISEGEYSHAFAYVGNQQIIESTVEPKNGVQIGDLDKYLGGNYDLCVMRLKEQSKVEPFLSVVYSKLGLKYGYRQMIVGLFYFLLKKVFRIDIKRNLTVSSSEVFCSTLIAEGLFSTVDSTIRPEVTSPENLRRMTHLFDTVYVLKARVE